MKIETLYRDCFPDILRYLKRFLGDAHAEELAQEVFIKAGKGLPGFRGEASPKTWLYRIADNALRDFVKSRGYRDEAAANGISEQELEACDEYAPAAPDVEQGLIRDEMNSCIREFIHRLPENYSSVLVLGDLEGQTNSEIADALGLSLETVKIRLHRARARLRQELSAGCAFSYSRDNELECQRIDCRQA